MYISRALWYYSYFEAYILLCNAMMSVHFNYLTHCMNNYGAKPTKSTAGHSLLVDELGLKEPNRRTEVVTPCKYHF